MADHEVSPNTIADLATLPLLSRSELIEHWQRAHRRPPPKGLSRRLLEFNAAFQLQATACGGLTPAVRRKLQKKVETRPAKPKSNAPSKTDGLYPGARLLRDWHGRTYTVEVLDDGFIYDGKHYASLSKIAHTITGSRWSGPRFFGL